MTVMDLRATSPLQLIAEEFITKFKEQENYLKSCQKTDSVRSSYFIEKKGESGFLDDLLDCLEEQGFSTIKSFVKPELNEKHRLPIGDFTKGISTLGENLLLKLKDFHKKMESYQEAGEGSFPPEYAKISSYFETAEKASNESAEAGRLILILSTISESMYSIKKTFQEYTPKTVVYFQDVFEKIKRGQVNGQDVLNLDRIKKTIDYMLKNLKSELLDLNELHKMVDRLKRQKREVIKILISFADQFKLVCNDKISRAMRNLSAWFDWECMVKEDEEAARVIEVEEFARSLSAFKKDLPEHVECMFSLSDNIQDSLQRKEKVGRFFYEKLVEMEVLTQTILESNIFIVPNLKVSLKRMHYQVKNTREIFSRYLEIEHKELEDLPQMIRKKINYISHEIPEVLCRGNPAEVKYMTLAVTASYKNIEDNLREALTVLGLEKELNPICKLIRHRYTEIVKSATQLVKFEEKKN